MPPNNDQYRHSIISTPRFELKARWSISRTLSFNWLICRRLSSIPRGSIVASHLSLPAIDRKASSVIPDELLDSEDSKPILDTLKEMINFTLLSNPIFMLVGLSNIFGMIGFYVPFVYLPNMAVLKGIALEDANFLISIIGKSHLNLWYQALTYDCSLGFRNFQYHWQSFVRMVFWLFMGRFLISDKHSHSPKWHNHLCPSILHLLCSLYMYGLGLWVLCGHLYLFNFNW